MDDEDLRALDAALRRALDGYVLEVQRPRADPPRPGAAPAPVRVVASMPGARAAGVAHEGVQRIAAAAAREVPGSALEVLLVDADDATVAHRVDLDAAAVRARAPVDARSARPPGPGGAARGADPA